jgi:hypothetical protein
MPLSFLTPNRFWIVQARQVSATKDAGAIASWALDAINVAEESHYFEEGITSHKVECKGIAGPSSRGHTCA